MPTSSRGHLQNRKKFQAALWLVVGLFAAGVLLPNFPQVFPRPLMAAAQALPAFIFALIHGANVYRLRGILAFIAISLLVGYTAEALGVHTGFPFGRYYFTGGMGPKLFDVPILMGPAYVGMGYISWTVARVITASENQSANLRGSRFVTLPLAASFVMVAWDIAIDPVLSTFAHYWIWTRGGAFFGVPISNFLGWYATNYLIYQSFILYARKKLSTTASFDRAQDNMAVLFYAVCAAGIVLRSLSTSGSSMVVDAAGVSWRVNHINAASIMAAIFIMGAFVMLGLSRSGNGSSDVTNWRYQVTEEFDKSEITFSRQDEFGETK